MTEAETSGWQDIRTAPKETPILLWHRLWECGAKVGYFHSESQWWRVGDKADWIGVGIFPTHWQPLPAPPAHAHEVQS